MAKLGRSARSIDGPQEHAMVTLPFPDRLEAGRLLATEPDIRKNVSSPIVIGLARGGVLVGAGMAQEWGSPLDVLVVRKLPIPWQSEVAMGALAGETCILNQHLIRDLRISDSEVRSVIAREAREIKQREELYREDRQREALSGRDVVLVDDGLATGATMVAAIRHVRSCKARRTIVAVPVASPEALTCVKGEADDCFCLTVPEPFIAVGHWYLDFGQVTDDEVRQFLRSSGTLTTSIAEQCEKKAV
jgi:putative phosphoribosyl transferase